MVVFSALNANKATVIDGDGMADAVKDPKVADLIASAIAYGESVRAAGRDHSVKFRD